jgi:hypothetical protein
MPYHKSQWYDAACPRSAYPLAIMGRAPIAAQVISNALTAQRIGYARSSSATSKNPVINCTDAEPRRDRFV